MQKKKAIIIGAGPAGLTAAYELIQRTDIQPIIYEQSLDIGGISKTVNYKGNRMDIGGHRFFSKSDRVMNWWLDFFPPQYREKSSKSGEPSHSLEIDPNTTDKVMLIRKRISRIYYLRKFFDYPIQLNLNTMKNLGLGRMARIGFSYMRRAIQPIRHEASLEDFLINRFGDVLYRTFFKDYTKKVWGVSCSDIKPEWGAQRIKGLSITKAIVHAVKQALWGKSAISQKTTETSLIEQFLYPKYGPGQIWEEVAKIIGERGGEIHLGHQAVRFDIAENRVSGVHLKDENGTLSRVDADYVFSTMPIKDLIAGITTPVPDDVSRVANGLMYRNFVAVGVLLEKLLVRNPDNTGDSLIKDNWIYIQEPEVRLGRLQIFNNWSPYMVVDSKKVWMGLEYFCNEGDELWSKSDREFAEFAVDELCKIDVIQKQHVLDSVVVRMPKTYPGYFGSYDNFHVIRSYIDKFENLYLIGRNGMHKYNNTDHSMLTAMTAVDNIANGISGKENIWAVNTEEEYHEVK